MFKYDDVTCKPAYNIRAMTLVGQLYEQAILIQVYFAELLTSPSKFQETQLRLELLFTVLN